MEGAAGSFKWIMNAPGSKLRAGSPADCGGNRFASKQGGSGGWSVFQEKWKQFSGSQTRQNRDLERFREKWKQFSGWETRQDKDLEPFGDSVKP